MGERARGFAIAVLVTVLDIIVVLYYGPAIWRAWGGTAWFHIVFLLLSGTTVFTLGDIWSRPLSASAKPLPLAKIDGDEMAANLRNNTLEGADV
jgi:hypothetical protein